MVEKQLQPDLSNPMHEAIFWRGVFIHRYAGVEHAVTELLLRAAGREEYKELGDLPCPWAKKLTRLGAILDAEGPLHRYADEVRDLLVPFTTIERHRHILAHGMMGLNVSGDQPRQLTFKGHEWIGGELGEVVLEISVDDLTGMTQDIGPVVQKFTQLVARIFRETKLMAIQVADRQPLTSVARQF